MPGYQQAGWIDLWSVTTAVTRLNERAAGITGSNPLQVNDYYQRAIFAVRVSAKVDFVIDAIRLLGAENVNGFPPAGDAGDEALWATVTDLGLNQGIVRFPRLKARDGVANNFAVAPILPRFLMLEYSATQQAGAPALTFIVSQLFLGWLPDGTE